MRSVMAILYLLSSTWAQAEQCCVEALAVTGDALAENALWVLSAPVCNDYREQALQRLEQQLATPLPIAAGADTHDVEHLDLERSELALMAASVRVRLALGAGDIPAAHMRLTAVEAAHANGPIAPTSSRPRLAG